MNTSHLLVTGFEPFVDVAVNPSGELVKLLHNRTLAGAAIHGFVLPVAFERIELAFTDCLQAMQPNSPSVLLSIGVQRGAYFRLEARARPVLASIKADNEGRLAETLAPLGAVELRTDLDLTALAQALTNGGAREVAISDDAGGFVCERCYWEVLTRAAQLSVPGLFLHVPPISAVSVDEQLPVVEALIVELVRQARIQRSRD